MDTLKYGQYPCVTAFLGKTEGNIHASLTQAFILTVDMVIKLMRL